MTLLVQLCYVVAPPVLFTLFINSKHSSFIVGVMNYAYKFHKNLSFGALTRFAVYNLNLYCTTCSSCLKVGPVLEPEFTDFKIFFNFMGIQCFRFIRFG